MYLLDMYLRWDWWEESTKFVVREIDILTYLHVVNVCWMVGCDHRKTVAMATRRKDEPIARMSVSRSIVGMWYKVCCLV